MSPIPLGILALAGAAAGAGAYDLLETQTLTSTASQITLSGLGSYSDYRDFQLVITGATTSGGTSLDFWFNNDTSSNKGYQYVRVISTTPSYSAYTNQSKLRTWNALTGTGQTPAPILIDIYDVHSTSRLKTFKAQHGVADGSYMHWFTNGTQPLSAAITQIDMAPAGADPLAAGTRISLYGRKG